MSFYAVGWGRAEGQRIVKVFRQRRERDRFCEESGQAKGRQFRACTRKIAERTCQHNRARLAGGELAAGSLELPRW